MLVPMEKIHTGVLREVVKDRAAAGTHWIVLHTLLRRLQLDEPLEEIRSHISEARSALERGDDEWAAMELGFADGLLRGMLGR
jgi:hypothetical protein